MEKCVSLKSYSTFSFDVNFYNLFFDSLKNNTNQTFFVIRKTSNLWLIWYMYLKIENCYLKIFIEIRVDEKCVEIWEMLFKN